MNGPPYCEFSLCAGGKGRT